MPIRPESHPRTSSSVCTPGGIAAAAREVRWTVAIASAFAASACLMSIPDHLEGAGEVLGVGRLVLDVVAGVRVLEAQAYGVQPLPLQPDPAGERRVGAVGEVADAGVLEGSHVHPDLVRAAGLEVDLQQAGE